MAKFTTNNNKSASTKLSPLFATKDLYYYISFNIMKFLIFIFINKFSSKRP